jgi:hypothetical protein
MFAPAETSNELTIYVDSMDAFAAFTCRQKLELAHLEQRLAMKI